MSSLDNRLTEFDDSNLGFRVVSFRQGTSEILDVATNKKFKYELSEYLGYGEHGEAPSIDTSRDYVIDMSRIQYVSAIPLGILIRFNQQHRRVRDGHAIRIANVNTNIQEVFRITRLGKAFGMYTTIEEAVSTPRDANGL